MTTEEFSNEFDVLVASYRRFKDYDSQELLDSIEFNEYEKSVFLTKAQEQLVLSYYNGDNSRGRSFEETEEVRRYLANLVKSYTVTPSLDANSENYTYSLVLPNKCWFITSETAKLGNNNNSCVDNTVVEVIPVSQDEYYRIKNNPFKQQNQRRVLRLDLVEGGIQLKSKYKVSNYTLYYLSKPSPIILAPLYNGVTVDNENTVTECELHGALHRPILEQAVLMALQSKNINVKNKETSN